MRVFILDPGNTCIQVGIKLHDKPLHLFVVLSRMALVDTILPYLLPDRQKERKTMREEFKHGLSLMSQSMCQMTQQHRNSRHETQDLP